MFETFLPLCLGILGLLIGSFLNVVIVRVPRDESIVRPPSHCPRCGHQIRWYENIPVLSWLALRGRCSGCKAPISPRYALVELLTGCLFLGCLARFGWTPELLAGLCFVTLLVPLIFIDAEHWILPFELTLPGIALGVLVQLPRGWPFVRDGLLGALAGYLFFRALEWGGWAVMRQEALGAGDKFLLALIGAFLGWRPLLGVVLLSSIQGAVFGLLRIAATGRAAPPMPEPVMAPPAEPAPGAKGLEPEPTFTADFLAPGLPAWKRLVLLPWTLLLQPIPDEPPLPEGAEGDEEPAWVPGPTNLPFGPWIGLAAVQLLLLGPWVSARLGHDLLSAMLRLVFSS